MSEINYNIDINKHVESIINSDFSIDLINKFKEYLIENIDNEGGVYLCDKYYYDLNILEVFLFTYLSCFHYSNLLIKSITKKDVVNNYVNFYIDTLQFLIDIDNDLLYDLEITCLLKYFFKTMDDSYYNKSNVYNNITSYCNIMKIFIDNIDFTDDEINKCCEFTNIECIKNILKQAPIKSNTKSCNKNNT